jgi:hypothetical protein
MVIIGVPRGAMRKLNEVSKYLGINALAKFLNNQRDDFDPLCRRDVWKLWKSS